MNITIDLTKKECLNDFVFSEGMETKENKDYLEKNFEEIVQNEIESLGCAIDEGDRNTPNVINDNRGKLWVKDDDFNEIGCIGFYATVSI